MATISQLSQTFPPKSLVHESDLKDLAGQVAIVTGGYAGIGYETARVLLQHNAKVYIAGRSVEKGDKAIAALEALTGKKAEFLLLDLGSIKASKAAAEELASKESRIHLLFNSAGVMTPPADSKTADGIELQWGTNCLGHFLFTETLLPTLKATAADSPAGSVRIITVSSSAHTLAVKGGVNLEDQTAGKKEGFYALYGQSKLGNIIQSQYLAEKLKSDGIICVAVHPGIIRTELVRTTPFIIRKILSWTVQHPPALGAITQLHAGCSASVTMAESGKYFVPWARVDMPARSETRDAAFCKKVMDLMRSQCDAHL